ncbi:acyl carrier protein [Streptomyces sp. NPDC085481]|uniref:acyl carrier protein n=1 Tax=Streptomyces sp. NPDC085481 TaxID=3365727 RepID=UPI0037CF1FBB
MDQALLDWFRTGPDDTAAKQPAPPVRLAPALPALSGPPKPPDLTPAALAAAPPGRRAHLLGDYLCQEIGRVLHCPAEAVDRDQTMTDLGVGSMTGLELRNRIVATLGAAPALTTILRAENVRELAAHLEGVLA